MSVGPLGSAANVAGTQRAQNEGADVERTQKETSDQAKQTEANRKAESASGIGETEQDQGTEERDADGRRIWEQAPEKQQEDESTEAEQPQGRDPTGQSGTKLDLSG